MASSSSTFPRNSCWTTISFPCATPVPPASLLMPKLEGLPPPAPPSSPASPVASPSSQASPVAPSPRVLALRRSKETTPEQRLAYYRFHAENKFRNDKKKLDAANFQVRRLECTLLRATRQRPRLQVVRRDQLPRVRASLYPGYLATLAGGKEEEKCSYCDLVDLVSESESD